MTIVEFLNARVDEDAVKFGEACEAEAERCRNDGIPDMTAAEVEKYWLSLGEDTQWPRQLREVAAKRAVIEFHKQWPVLVEGPPKYETDTNGLDAVSFKMSRQIAWATEQEYRKRFGDEPPTTPIMRALASVYSDHPDYNEAWAL